MYHGLRNQGYTCYLNSVLQVLFMTKEFRQNLKVPRRRDKDPNIIDHELTELFGELEKRPSNTYKITRKLDISNVWEQRDAAEYFERILRLTSEEASKVFHGELINRNTCSKCKTDTDISAAFWYLPLALVDSCSDYSVLQGVKDLFRPSELSGENQMYCGRCGDKCDATIMCVLERHPEVLVLLLKRFDFDIRYMSYVKLDCDVDVPFTLQIPQDQTYELFAFVDHFGSLRSGHYTTTVRSQDDDKWYMFDDDRVSQCYQWFQLDTNEKLSNAYLLFYRKHKVVPADTSSQDVSVVSTPRVQQVDIRMKKDGLETENAPTRDVDFNAAASASTEDVSGLKRPAAPERPCNHDDEGGVRRNKPPHQHDRDEDKDCRHNRITKQKEDDNEKSMTLVDDQRRTKADESVKNDGLGSQLDLQNIPHNFIPYVSVNQTTWGPQDDIGDRTWIEMEEKRSEAEHQKNEEFHHVTDQNRQKLDPNPVIVQMPTEDEETDSEGNSAGTSSAQVERFSHRDELNQEVITGKRERFDVSGDIPRYYHGFRATDANRDYDYNGDDKKRSERQDNVREDVRDNLKVNKERSQEYEHKPSSNLRKADEETTGTDDSGTGRAEMCRAGNKETGKLWKRTDLYKQDRMSDERNSPKEGISDSSRRCDDQREDRKDVQGPDDGPRRRGSTNNLKHLGVFHEGDEEIIKLELIKAKGGDLNDRKGCDKLNTEENSKKMEQRSRGYEGRRTTSERDTNGRSDNPGRNRSPEQPFSPTQTEAKLCLKGRSVGKGLIDDQYETYECPPTDDTTEGRRRLKSEKETKNYLNKNQVRPETQPDTQDALNRDMTSLSVTEYPPEGIEGVELEANGKNQAKRKCNGNSFSLLCCKRQKNQMDSE